MYLKEVVLENYGPCNDLKIEFNFDASGNPIPLVLVGANGSGKTLLLSHIVNSLIAAKQEVYEDVEVERGKVYKYRTPAYISREKWYSFSKVTYTNGAYVREWQLNQMRRDCESTENFKPPREEWGDIQPDATSSFESDITKDQAENLVSHSCILYFPANRFEEPAWLNKEHLTKRLEYQDIKHTKGVSNRNIIAINSLKECQSWLLDIMLDRYTLDILIQPTKIETKQGNHVFHVFYGYQGSANTIYDEIIKLLNKLFNESGTLRLGLGDRKSRLLSIIKSEQAWVPNLFQLSSGESLLLGLFLNIIRDYDLSKATFTSLSEITGVVVIDEVDAHLHNKLQKDILPSLLKLFPKIQFILTTHSPMFLLGMERAFTTDGYDILELPTGARISIENFSEFDDLFSAISESQKHVELVKNKINESHLPVVFVEGDYDVKYLSKTIELFYGADLSSRFTLCNGDGFGNLDKIWHSLDTKAAQALTSDILLLYDCDTKKVDKDNGKSSKKVIPTVESNIIKKGIENLFSGETIAKLEKHSKCFIDVSPATTKTVRGVVTVVPATKEINKDEKRNICDWLIANGDESDFEGFKTVVEIIKQFLER